MSRLFAEFHCLVFMGIGTIRSKNRWDTHHCGKVVHYNPDICSRCFDPEGI